MPPVKDHDHEKLVLRLAQFRLLCKDDNFVNSYDIQLVFQDLNINTKVPGTSFLNQQDDYNISGDSLLHLAYKEINIKLFNILISKGADFNIKDREGKTVLHKAFHRLCFCYCEFKEIYEITHTVLPFVTSILSAHVKYRNTDNPSSEGLTHFHIACATNNTKAVEFFLNNGVKVDQVAVCVHSKKYFRGYTPLHFAAEFGWIQVIKILLKHGANSNLENDEGKTPIHIAIEKNIDILDSDLPRNVDINEFILELMLSNSSSKVSKIFAVSAMKDSYKAEILLNQGVDVNQIISMDSEIWPGYTALHFAAFVNIDTVKLLVRRGGNIEAKEATGVTPLDMCIDRYDVEDIIEIIDLVPSWKGIVMSDGETKLQDILHAFQNSTDISTFLQLSKDNVKLYVPFDSPMWPGCTILHLAVLFTERKNCKRDYKDKEGEKTKVFDPDFTIIRECLKQNADVTIKDHRQWTPVHLAFRLEKKNTLNLLLQYHHRIKSITDQKNLSHLHIACAEKNKDFVQKLLWNDADVNVIYEGDTPVSGVYPGWTPLHVAVYQRNLDIVKLLIEFGADIYTPDTCGFTPVHRLMRCTDMTNIGQIVFNVPNLRDIVIENMGLSYFHVACAVGNINAVKRLLELGADVNKAISYREIHSKSHPRIFDDETYDGSTPLHLALEYCDADRAKMVKLLLERGADVLAKKLNYATPLYRILEFRYSNFVDVIIQVFKQNGDLQRRVELETGVTMLHIAVCRVDVDLARELLDNGADVNAQIHENSPTWAKFTCLHVLMSSDEDLSGDDDNVNEMIKLLLDRHADVTLMNDKKDTPLHIIYREICINLDVADLGNVILLLRAHKNFEVNPTSFEGISHFHIACHMLEVDVVKDFLEHGVDVNSKIDAFCDSKVAANTPLHLALQSTVSSSQAAFNPFLRFAKLKIVDLLIKHGADVNVEDVFGYTPAHIVSYCNFSREHLLQRLVNSGANVNARNVRGETPLELLLTKEENFYANVVQSFVMFGCRLNEFNTVTQKGYLALVDTVASRGEMLDLLIGTFVNFPDLLKVDDMKSTAIHNVVSINSSDSTQARYVELFDVFMEYGCDIDDQDNLGRTALHVAAQFRNETAVEGLLAAGADINVTDRNGKTPFAYVFEPCSRCPTGNDTDHNQYSHNELFRIFMSQMKKMEFCDIYISSSNETLLNRSLERFDSDDILDDLYGVLPEVEQIANIKIDPYALSAADFVAAAAAIIDYPLMSLAKRKAIDAFFRINKGPFQKKFKLCAGILQLQYRQALLRRKIIDTAIESLRVLARCRLPDICSHIILRSLKNIDLQNLISSTAENGVTNTMDVDC